MSWLHWRNHQKAASEHLEAGDRLLEHQNYSEALQHYRSALSADHGSLDAMIAIANVCEAMRQFGDMLSISKKAVAAYPNDARAVRCLSRAYDRHGDADKALEVIDRAIQLTPGDADGYAILGRLLLQRGYLSEAIDSLIKAVALNSRHPEAEYKLATAYLKQERYAEAANHLEHYVEVHPLPWAHFDLSTACRHLGRTDEMAEHLKIAAQMGYPDARKLLAEPSPAN